MRRGSAGAEKGGGAMERISLFEEFRRARKERPEAPAFLIASGDRSLPIS